MKLNEDQMPSRLVFEKLVPIVNDYYRHYQKSKDKWDEFERIVPTYDELKNNEVSVSKFDEVEDWLNQCNNELDLAKDEIAKIIEIYPNGSGFVFELDELINQAKMILYANLKMNSIWREKGNNGDEGFYSELSELSKEEARYARKSDETAKRVDELWTEIMKYHNELPSENEKVLENKIRELKRKEAHKYFKRLLSKWYGNENTKIFIEHVHDEIIKSENYIEFLKLLSEFLLLNKNLGLLEEEKFSENLKLQEKQLIITSIAFGMETSFSVLSDYQMPEFEESPINLISYPFISYLINLAQPYFEEKNPLEKEKMIERICELVINISNDCYVKGIGYVEIMEKFPEEHAKIIHRDIIRHHVGCYQDKMNELRDLANKPPRFLGKAKWERKILSIMEVLERQSSYFPYMDKQGEEFDFWNCLYNIHKSTENMYLNYKLYLYDRKISKTERKMYIEEANKNREEIAEYFDKYSISLDELQLSLVEFEASIESYFNISPVDSID